MIKRKQLLTVLIIALTIPFLHLTTVSASELNFAVEPLIPENQRDKTKTYFDLLVKPDSEQTIEINLRNDTENEVIVEPKVHSATTNLNGVVEYGPVETKRDSTLKHDLNEVVSVEKEVKIPAQSSVKLPLTITVPKEEFNGILAGGITLQEKETKNNDNTETKGLSIQNQYAYVVALVLNENNTQVKPELKLNKVFPDQVNARNVINANLQNSTPNYLNQLNVVAKITQKGKTTALYETTKKAMQMAPNSNFDFPISLAGEKLEAGEYTLELTATTKADRWHWKKNFTIKADEAKKLNAKDVTIKKDYTWLYIMIGIGLIVLSILIVILILKRKRKKEEERKRRNRIKRKKKKTAQQKKL
ncbi:DUF916 and DUF3324 domain-containing protein [Carnobacterium divergens]|uniref:Cell wall anchor protein n=1 Tax=Carnobacterium divergens TaxID=2748 RepID=A0A7Z8G544_CARDV|nr:DUF916 and DUF3324 domain-containing protein [Carnobacterium divergens]MPQ23360.1 DUF916 and DUF3324 domain-containing protein [Carnobacterium divergens]TFI74491.1 cell wall anchor protein [Carnobacterium divergens]TFI78813.1 cell wall anchor protein [Carnobacterium divergens]TFI85372.1 cell wall anchor protein [Carnobacterium divergens]TFI97727.1 cell wall anchor protein [Carnobacterium divergens]